MPRVDPRLNGTHDLHAGELRKHVKVSATGEEDKGMLQDRATVEREPHRHISSSIES